MDRYICIHGHFYQPPRENAWLEAIELQDSAYPYHDWNERICAECYAANATSRILNEKGQIVEIVNNYSKISFNFGPTLLAWLDQHAPVVYRSILEADRESRDRFSGHGSALAQPYNHMIMPLANLRDKATQILWGIRDFEYRFGRQPEGMWLPETAVDLATLDLMAEFGLRFTVLAPHQAQRIKPPDAADWQDVSGAKIDPTVSYRIQLPSGRNLTLFFYDGPISRAVAFEGLLNQGEIFAHRLMEGFSEDRSGPQLLHIATDGESYGHHHPHGDMALAYVLHYIESNGLARITNYGEFLEKNPPEFEVAIFENSSWSCPHGVERWRNDCGCRSGQNPKWRQRWRAPLREAFDWLRDTLAPAAEDRLKELLPEPWKARNDYIHLILDRSPESTAAFIDRHAARPLAETEKTLMIKLMELQRHAMLMYTSCGWFFDEISGIETVQIIQYAARVLQLAQEIFGKNWESRFLARLQKAESNIHDHENGRRIYAKFVKPAMVNLETVGAHYAISTLFDGYGQTSSVYAYAVERELYQRQDVGRTKLAVGRIRVRSEVTGESRQFCFGILHWGYHNLSGCIRPCSGDKPGQAVIDEVFENFNRAAFPETLSLLEKSISASAYSLRNLFKDEQRRIINIVLDSTLTDAEGMYRQIYETNAPLLRFLKDNGIPAPQAISAAAAYVLNVMLKRAFEEDTLDLDQIRVLLENINRNGIALDATTLEITMRRRLERMITAFFEAPSDIGLLREVTAVTDILELFPFELNLRKVQNMIYDIQQAYYPEYLKRSAKRDKTAQKWVSLFKAISDKLNVQVRH